jgi:hypothetical protein
MSHDRKVNVRHYEYGRENSLDNLKKFKKVFKAATGSKIGGGFCRYKHYQPAAVHHPKSAPLYSRTKLNWMWQCLDARVCDVCTADWTPALRRSGVVAAWKII